MRTRLKSSPLPLRGRLRRELRYASQGIAAAAFADVICLAFGADVTAIAIVGAIGAGGGGWLTGRSRRGKRVARSQQARRPLSTWPRVVVRLEHQQLVLLDQVLAAVEARRDPLLLNQPSH